MENKIIIPKNCSSITLQFEFEEEKPKSIWGTKDFDYKTIKTYEDAVKARKVDDDDIIYPTDRPHIVAYKKICHIIKVINNGWVPNWSDSDQRKYFPWFEVSPSGSGFSDSYFGCSYTSTRVGSRLLTDTSEKASYLASQLQYLYSQYLL